MPNPNFLYRAAVKPKEVTTDPEFHRLWAMENRGQTGGKVDADINAELMWSQQTGSKQVVIGVVDTGIDYNHPDLIDNLWINANETKDNGIDDDLNGYIDDINGINAIKNNGNPFDDNMHGTHVSGTIGAVGNNNVGVAGVAHSVQIVACKFLSGYGGGTTADAVKCMQYLGALKTRADNPVNLVATDNSWGGGGRSQALFDSIKAHEELGILFFAAAGNDRSDNDVTDSYPANYDIANVVSIAATDHNDRLASFSNYGKRKVHIGAPGVKILSTLPNNKYGELSGTSMATPHVTGLCAIIASEFPDLDFHGRKNLILAGGQRIDSMATTTISGRRLRGADENGIGSLTCKDQTLIVRKAPAASNFTIELGQPLFLSAQYINCSEAGGKLSLYAGPLGEVVLEDKGENGDSAANDGIYSLNWQPDAVGDYELTFSDGDVVLVNVYDVTSINNYIATDVPHEYHVIEGERMRAGDDTMHQLDAPFAIRFAGNATGFTKLYLSSNGTISFTDKNQPGFLNRSQPTTVVNTLVTPMWDDLAPVFDDSDIYHQVIGEAPSRKLVIEWRKFTHFQAPDVGTFQVVFHEDSPNIAFNYHDTDFASAAFDKGASATIGVQTSQTKAVEYSFNQPKVSSASSILFVLE